LVSFTILALALAAGPLNVRAIPAGAVESGGYGAFVWSVTFDVYDDSPDFELSSSCSLTRRAR
jgi:hypothetical protein